MFGERKKESCKNYLKINLFGIITAFKVSTSNINNSVN